MAPFSPTVRQRLPLALRTWVICLTAYLCCSGVFALIGAAGLKDLDEVFLGLYVLLFALGIFAFEATRFVSSSDPAQYVEAVYRRNFGFMLKAPTRGMFLIFVGFMALGLNSPIKYLTLFCGILTVVTGIVYILLACRDPDLFSEASTSSPEPYAPPITEMHPGAPGKWEP